ncbi:MAG: BatA domain-containing protein [Planctomycetota bacterium]
MTFGLLSTIAVLLGIAVLAIALFLLQRLRVQHREVEVLSTLFWQAAIEETRARVFVRCFRHWPAWVLLVAIASLLWLLLAQPASTPLDGTQHVVLLDWSVDEKETRTEDLKLAIDRASTLPTTAREIIAVGDFLETLLVAGEPIELASIRATDDASEDSEPAPKGIGWAVESLSYRANTEEPLAIHLIGDAELDEELLNGLRSNVSVYRIPRSQESDDLQLNTLGVADAQSGQWSMVDVAIGITSKQPIELDRLQVTVDDQPIKQNPQRVSENELHFLDVAAGGGLLEVSYGEERIGAMTLPRRELIRVAIDAAVPETLKELIRIDRACEIVTENADVSVGFDADDDLRLSGDDDPAFSIESEAADPGAALNQLIDELALRQIDAMAIAEETGRIIDVQVAAAEERRIAIWNRLFTSSFDFAESRACPILVARSIRWLADRPPLIPWAEQGERLPAAAPEFDRAYATTATTSDGREVVTTRLSEPIAVASNLQDSPQAGLFSRVGLLTWFGLIVSTLLAGEWMLYQRGRMP